MIKNILAVPLDPVHDVGLKIIKNFLEKHGHKVNLIMPDLKMEEIIGHALKDKYDYIFVSRTLSYGIHDMLAKFIDLCDAAGLRNYSKLVIGGKAITPKVAAELGFDKGFSSTNALEEILAFIENRQIEISGSENNKEKRIFVNEHSYKFFNDEINSLLTKIVNKLLLWSEDKSSPGILRAQLMDAYLKSDKTDKNALNEYLKLCDKEISEGNLNGRYIKGVRTIKNDELENINYFIKNKQTLNPITIQHDKKHPLIFKFLGSGCPIMDITHAKICERWGTDGFLLINPSWEARYEGLFHDNLTHQNDGTITSLENISLIRNHLHKSSYLTVRAHRGLNTVETILLAGFAGADMSKINLVYGSLGAGTDPERLAIDGIEAIKLSSRFKMPFDIPGNDELSGVPTYKTLAGILINVKLGLILDAKPIPKPLFCFGPNIMINGQMNQNYIDYNFAKISALRKIADVPIWPGEPIAFMTQSEERVQSANSTSYHASLAASLGVDAITVASTDEAYSRGPICISSRIDSLRAIKDAFKFMGNTNIEPTKMADKYTSDFIENITKVLIEVEKADNLPQAIYNGSLGNREEDGAYPGTFGRNTIIKK